MMTSFYMVSLIIGCAVVTWVPRILPFTIVKTIIIPDIFIRWLSYIPVCILTALVIDSFLHKDESLRLDTQYIIAFIPTLIIAWWTKSLSITVIVGVLSMALLRYIFL